MDARARSKIAGPSFAARFADRFKEELCLHALHRSRRPNRFCRGVFRCPRFGRQAKDAKAATSTRRERKLFLEKDRRRRGSCWWGNSRAIRKTGRGIRSLGRRG